MKIIFILITLQFFVVNSNAQAISGLIKDEENNDEEGNNDETLDKPADPQAPSAPKPIDSSRYHYQPSNDSPDAGVKKTEVSMRSRSLIKGSVKITDLTSAFFERFTL